MSETNNVGDTCQTGRYTKVFGVGTAILTIPASQYANCNFIKEQRIPDINISISTISKTSDDTYISVESYTIIIGTMRVKISTDFKNIEVSGCGYSLLQKPTIVQSPDNSYYLPSNNFTVGMFISQHYTVTFKWLINIQTHINDRNGKTWIDIGYTENPNISYDSDGSVIIPQLLKNIDNTSITPSIYITGMSLVDGSDIGETIFNVIDKYNYYEKCREKYEVEHINLENGLILTKFQFPCVIIVSVVIGDKSTLRDKIGVIYNLTDFKNFNIFYENFFRYSMLRYILSKILYGYFNIKYLKQKYYKKFLIDLQKSRFSNFIKFFENPLYSETYKYFI